MMPAILEIGPSNLLVLHSVNKEEESRTWVFLVLLVAVAEGSVHVVARSAEDLDLVELGLDVFTHGSGSLHKGLHSVSLACAFKVRLDLREVLCSNDERMRLTLDVSAPGSLLKFDFLESEAVNNVDNVGDIVSAGSAIAVLVISYNRS